MFGPNTKTELPADSARTADEGRAGSCGFGLGCPGEFIAKINSEASRPPAEVLSTLQQPNDFNCRWGGDSGANPANLR